MKSLGATFVLALVVAGCAPLSQAPLIYSSANKIGVGIASGTSSEPGLDLHIGAKSVDVAYVPTVVGRPCKAEGSDIAKCGSASYKLLQVVGQSSVPVDRSAARNAVTAADNALAAASANLARSKQALDAITKQNQDYIAAKARIGEIEAEQAQLDPANTVRAAQLDGEKTGLNSIMPPDEAASNSARANFTRDARAEETAQTALTAAKAELARREAEQRVDALAVYGTFEGKGSGGRDGGSLDMGKVFATGLAAQSMAEGARVAAPLVARSACTRALIAAKVLDAETPPEQAISILEAGCGGEARPPNN